MKYECLSGKLAAALDMVRDNTKRILPKNCECCQMAASNGRTKRLHIGDAGSCPGWGRLRDFWNGAANVFIWGLQFVEVPNVLYVV